MKKTVKWLSFLVLTFIMIPSIVKAEYKLPGNSVVLTDDAKVVCSYPYYTANSSTPYYLELEIEKNQMSLMANGKELFNYNIARGSLIKDGLNENFTIFFDQTKQNKITLKSSDAYQWLSSNFVLKKTGTKGICPQYFYIGQDGINAYQKRIGPINRSAIDRHNNQVIGATLALDSEELYYNGKYYYDGKQELYNAYMEIQSNASKNIPNASNTIDETIGESSNHVGTEIYETIECSYRFVQNSNDANSCLVNDFILRYEINKNTKKIQVSSSKGTFNLSALNNELSKIENVYTDKNILSKYVDYNETTGKFTCSSNPLYLAEDNNLTLFSDAGCGGYAGGISCIKSNAVASCEPTGPTGSTGSTGGSGCAILSPVVREKLNWFLNIIKYGGSILAIILGMLDFVKAIFSDKDDASKEAGKKFIKRLIAAAILFLLPLILQFFLNIVEIPGFNQDNPYCQR